MSLMDLDAFRGTELVGEPYEHVIVSDFVKPDGVAAIQRDYPRVPSHGSYPASELTYGAAFAALLDELAGAEIAAAFADKFALDLADRPRMITVRGHCRRKDGRIHTDTRDKLITALIYMNTDWENPAGRLRVLRSADDLDDYAAEVPPVAGTLLAFRRGERSYHGHTPYDGERRVVQLNWVTEDRVARRELARHRRSARLKRLFRFA